MTTITDDIAAIKAALDAGPDVYGWRGFDGVIRDCIAPDTHAASPGSYTIKLYAICPDRIRRLVEHVEHETGHVYRLREQIARDTDTIYTLRGLLSLARDALADCLDDAPTADQLSVSGGVYEGVAAKSAIRAIDEALERTQ